MFGSNNAYAIRKINMIQPGPINPMESQSLALNNNSLETRASVKDIESYDYLRSQLEGMVKMFEVHMTNHYFDLIVELESKKTDLYRIGEIIESLTRHGIFLSSTEALTILSKTRKVIDESQENSAAPYNQTTVVRLTMSFANPSIPLNAPNVLNEPNPLNKPNGLQPNASAFQEFFSSSYRRQEFALILLELLSSHPYQAQINPTDAILQHTAIVFNRQV